MGRRGVKMPALYNGDGRLSAEQIEMFTAAFKMFDSDGSGAISTSEFRNVCLEIGMQPTDRELEDMVNELDQDKSGDIDLHEFLLAMQSKIQDAEGEEIVKEAFRMFDEDDSGTLDHNEMTKILENMGERLDKQEIQDLIETVDVDGDGEIDLKEFLAVVLDRAAV